MSSLTSRGLALLLLAMVGCSVPDLGALENEKPRECNEEHRCRDGELCVEGFCQENPCDGVEPTTAYRDADEDGHGVVDAAPEVFCGDVPAGYATSRDDCDDARAEVHPGLPEVCDGLDNDCREGIDNGLARTEYFRDADGDGVGVQADSQQSCGPPAGYVQSPSQVFDCDDNDAERTPGKAESCDGKDNDCAGGVDDGFDRHWYRDEDGDTHGRNEAPTVSCEAPGPGYVHVTTGTFDCDDTSAEVHPGAMEKCNNRDDNCQGGEDEPFLTGARRKGAACNNDVCTGTYTCTASGDDTVCDAPAPMSHFPDVDGDGEGAANATAQTTCTPNAPPAGRAFNALDCDDVDPNSRKAGTEVCDAVDNDCDGQVDDGLSCGGTLKQVFDFNLGGTGHDWRAVAMGPGGYPLWIAGLSGKLAVRKTAGAAFQGFDGGQPNSCSTITDWRAAWVRPSDGSVFLAGANGRLAQHSGTSCVLQTTTPVVQTRLSPFWAGRPKQGGEGRKG
ncbi:putative metal-binding motif-containing protein [Pyxidicoccus trucidator]|uniref:putative metal-binding motif-containing protein n=1 Tax=Pyxidicoccus trucidator TaxID=2709662 RepID=UPI0013DCADFC|nr:putative metal-binding motif-containing protein [Pyxidicoccus trucidator]